MIVKNESANMVRCLDSVRELCDFMTICDTGSTDDTVQIIESYFAQHNVAGKVFRHEWKNFGHNRTLSMQVARETGATYALTIDADMVIEVSGAFNKAHLTHDSYTVVQRSEQLYYPNSRIFKLDREWKCVGVTHEYWSCPGSNSAPVQGLIIDDVGDGGAKADKFERDLKLLTQGLVDEPNNARYVFYLAQTYKCLGDYTRAQEWYEKRIGAGGWDQEVWYSKYMVGHCLNQRREWPRALEAYMLAWSSLPSRAEPLLPVVKHYREIGENLLAYQLCLLALKIPFPTQSPLFCEAGVYVSSLYLELSIVAFAANDRLRGLLACEKIIHDCLPWAEYAGDEGGRLHPNEVVLTTKNREYYITKLPISGSKKIDVPVATGWHLCNPYLVARPLSTGSRHSEPSTILLVRSVNYALNGETGLYHIPHGGFRTTNYVTCIDNRELCKDASMLQGKFSTVSDSDKCNKPHTFPTQMHDYEDVRLVQCNGGSWYGVATSRELNAENKCEMILLSFVETDSDVPTRIDRVVRLRGYHDKEHQKNWMPFVYMDELYFVYMCEPLTILKCELDSGTVHVVWEQPNDMWDCGTYRGSSNGVPWQGGYLFVVHEVEYHPVKKDNKTSQRRVYTHRFVLLQRTEVGATVSWALTKISHPFFFFSQGVEFVTGMSLVHDGDRQMLCIGVGKRDCEAHVVQVDPAQVNRWLTHGQLLLLPL